MPPYPLIHAGGAATCNHSGFEVLLHSWGVCVALSALMSGAFSFNPALDWWSGGATCKWVLRHVAATAQSEGGTGGPFLYRYLRCHIDEGQIGSGLIWVFHHGDVLCRRPSLSSGMCVCVCVHLCGSLTKCFPSVKHHSCSLFLSHWIYITEHVVCISPLNSTHDFMENHSPLWSCLFSFSHLNTKEERLKKGLIHHLHSSTVRLSSQLRLW